MEIAVLTAPGPLPLGLSEMFPSAKFWDQTAGRDGMWGPFLLRLVVTEVSRSRDED